MVATEPAHPSLFVDAQRVTAIRAAVTTSGTSQNEIYALMRDRVNATATDIIDGGTATQPGRNYARNYLAREAAAVYAIGGESAYAQIAYNAIAAIYSDPSSGTTIPEGVGAKGLERATLGKGLAMAYDLAYHGWSEPQRSFVRGHIRASLDYWRAGGNAFDNNKSPYGSNWVAVCYGSQVMQMLAIGMNSNDESWLAGTIEDRLVKHIHHYGDKGWTQEGNYYTTYAQQFLLPAALALHRVERNTVWNTVKELEFHKLAMYSGMFDGLQRSTHWGVGGEGLGAQGWTSLIFAVCPTEELGYYRWFYDRYRGQLNPAEPTARYEPANAGRVFALLLYPEAAPRLDPTGIMASGLTDSGGGYWFRDRWQDKNDLIVALATDTKAHADAWDEADALQLNILGFGTKWTGAPGKTGDPAYFSQVLVDGMARASHTSTGKAVSFQHDSTGAYAIAEGGNKYGGLGIDLARRHVLIRKPDDSGLALISTVDQITSGTLHSFTWQLNDQGMPIVRGTENGVATFMLLGDGDAFLKGWVLHTTGPATEESNPVGVTFQANDATVWVAMVAGRGAAPAATITGSGLGSVLSLGRRQLRWNAVAQAMEVTILSTPAPMARFVATPSTGPAPLTVAFSLPGSGITSYLWDFGDGTTSTAAAPSHLYTNGGTYAVRLTVVAGGQTSTATQLIRVENRAPAVIVTGTPTAGAAPLAVTLSAAGTTDADGHALSYAWDFGDGTSATGLQVNKTYTTQGTYFATVTADDNHGGRTSQAVRIAVGNQAPIPVFTSSVAVSTLPVTVSFNAGASTDPENDALTYSWNFGDGQTGTGVTVSHAYATYGSKTVTLTVNDGRGNSVSAVQEIRIENQPPRAQFTLSAVRGNAPLSVTFNAAASSDPEGTALTYAWDLGDGTTATGISVTKVYNTPRNIRVQLTVTDAQGATSTSVADLSALSAGLRMPDNPTGTLPGVWYENFDVAHWDRDRNDFTALTPVGTGVMPTIDIRRAPQNQYFAYRFSGYIAAPQDGTFTFAALMRDSFQLTVGDQVVVPFDVATKLHSGPISRSGSIGLKQGKHAFEILFHATDMQVDDWYPVLELTWNGPGISGPRPIAASELSWQTGRASVGFDVSRAPGDLLDPMTVQFFPVETPSSRIFYALPTTNKATLSFDAGPSMSNNDPILQYVWDFGDGTRGAGRAVTHTFAKTTTPYVVKLDVITQSGAKYTSGKELNVIAPPTRLNYAQIWASRIDSTPADSNAVSAKNLFDGFHTGDRWLVNDLEGYVEVHLVGDAGRHAYRINEFTLTNPNDWNDRDPKTVVFSGTRDGDTWIPIQTWTGVDWAGAVETPKSFVVTAPIQEYSGYRWDLVAKAESPQGPYLELQEIQMFHGGQQVTARRPTAVLSAPAAGSVGQRLTFTGGGSISPDGYPLMYFWDFGDGQTARTGSPTASHIYYAAGSYQTRLTVRDTLGNVHVSGATTVTVGSNANRPPVAAFTFTQSDGVFAFDAGTSSDPDGDALSYRWQFGDGSGAIGRTASHTFPPGDYAVMMTVTDPYGNADTAVRMIDAIPAVSDDVRVISCNFGDSSNATLVLRYDDIAGVVPMANWNACNANASALKDNTGTATTMGLNFNRWRSWNGAIDTRKTGTGRMLSTWSGDGPNALVGNLTQIPYTNYDVIVYSTIVQDLEANTTMSVSIGPTTRYLRDEDQAWNGKLEESVAQTANDAIDGPTYVVFENLSGATCTITFANVPNGGPCGIQVVERGQAQTAGTIEMDSTPITVDEGTSATMTVRRVGGSSGAVSVSYLAVNGSAIAGQDFTPTTGTLSWANGDQTDRTITIPITNDGQTEFQEDFIVRLRDVTGGTLDWYRRSRAVVIRNPNQPPVVNAGADQNGTLVNGYAEFTLNGTYADDGLPGTTPVIRWSVIEGPSVPAFVDSQAANTRIVITVPGLYRLRLKGDDGQFSAEDDVYIRVPASDWLLVNFQPSSAVTPPPYKADSGAVFGNRGNGWTYGWLVAQGSFAKRNTSTDPLYDTVVEMKTGTWQAAVTNGRYRVQLICGDPKYPSSSLNSLVVDGITVTDTDGQDARDDFDVTVTVDDGLLTIAQVVGNNKARLCAVNIIPLAESGAPLVDAGVNLATNVGQAVGLAGSAVDPQGQAMTYQWRMVVGPQPAVFANAAALTTAVTFPAAGTYVLVLTASDGSLTGSDSIVVTAAATSNAPPVITVQAAAGSEALVLP